MARQLGGEGGDPAAHGLDHRQTERLEERRLHEDPAVIGDVRYSSPLQLAVRCGLIPSDLPLELVLIDQIVHPLNLSASSLRRSAWGSMYPATRTRLAGSRTRSSRPYQSTSPVMFLIRSILTMEKTIGLSVSSSIPEDPRTIPAAEEQVVQISGASPRNRRSESVNGK